MNPSIIQDILVEFEEQKIVLEKDGSYEVAHDILAARLNERRITEDHTNLRATGMVYQTEANQGDLNEQQLAFIEPYFARLAFADEDRERLYKYIADCKERIESEKQAQTRRAEVERELREQAEANEQKALKRRNISRVFAVIGVFCAAIAAFSFAFEREKTIIILKRDAQDYLSYQQYEYAYKAIANIQEARGFVPFFLPPDSLITEIDKLKQTLLFHITSSKIKAQEKYVLYKAGSNVIGKKPVNSMEDDNTAIFFNGKFPNLSNIGFSTNTDHFFIAESIGAPSSNSSENSLKVFTIHKDYSVTGRVIDTVEKAAADFDPDGNLFYLSKDTIWRYDVAGNVSFIQKLNVHRTGKTTELTFIKTRTKATLNKSLSDYFRVNMEDSIFLFNRNNFRFLSLPATSTIDIDSNRYLIYRYECNGGMSPLYRVDLQDPALATVQVSRRVSDNFARGFYRFIIPFKREDARPPLVQSPDRAKSIQYDVARSGFFVRNQNGEFRLKPGKTEVLNAYEVLDGFFVYVCEDVKEKFQIVYMQRHGSMKPRAFRVPANWKFLEFKDKKYMLFRYSDEAKNLELQSLLIIDPYMVEDDYLERWFQRK